MVASTYKVFLGNTPDGQSSATTAEDVNQVQHRLTERLATSKIVSIEVPTPPTINP
jgi:hypothetical protein